jgi:hypothetical protein
VRVRDCCVEVREAGMAYDHGVLRLRRGWVFRRMEGRRASEAAWGLLAWLV